MNECKQCKKEITGRKDKQYCNISCKKKEEPKNDLILDAQFLTKKDYLNLAVIRLNEITDDEFLERIQYDYTKNCLINKDSIAIVENDGYRINQT